MVSAAAETSAGNQYLIEGAPKGALFLCLFVNLSFKFTDKTLNLQDRVMSYFGKFLIIENDSKILDILCREKSLLDKYPSSTARTIVEATGLIQKNGKEFRMIFVSERLAKLSDLTQFKKALESIPDVGLALLGDKNEYTPAREFISRIVEVPSSYMDLVKIVELQTKNSSDWRKTQNDGETKEVEISSGDEKYIAIPMRDFVITPKSYFNFYLRLSSGKYIKVFNAGDDLSQDEVNRYSSRGIDDFYVPKEEHEKFVRLKATLSNNVVLSDAANSFKVKTLMKLGANVTNNLLKCGITPDRMDNAQIFLDQTIHVLRQMKMKDEVVTSYLKNIDKNEHSAAIAFIAGILANHLGFESSKSIKVVGTTALLHDIGLYDLDPTFVEGEEIKDENKKAIFDKHSAHGAEILRATGAFEEVICHAVENHHRRRLGGGGRRSSSVNLVTEIVSVADEFFNTVIHQGYSPERVRFFMENELKNYSPNVERAFQLLTKGKKAG